MRTHHGLQVRRRRMTICLQVFLTNFRLFVLTDGWSALYQHGDIPTCLKAVKHPWFSHSCPSVCRTLGQRCAFLSQNKFCTPPSIHSAITCAGTRWGGPGGGGGGGGGGGAGGGGGPGGGFRRNVQTIGGMQNAQTDHQPPSCGSCCG